VIDAMAMDESGKREAVVVCHGGVLQMARYLAGRTTRETYLEPYPEYLEILTLEL
jgi:broad specificity phosphatase PhoE